MNGRGLLQCPVAIKTDRRSHHLLPQVHRSEQYVVFSPMLFYRKWICFRWHCFAMLHTFSVVPQIVCICEQLWPFVDSSFFFFSISILLLLSFRHCIKVSLIHTTIKIINLPCLAFLPVREGPFSCTTPRPSDNQHHFLIASMSYSTE